MYKSSLKVHLFLQLDKSLPLAIKVTIRSCSFSECNFAGQSLINEKYRLLRTSFLNKAYEKLNIIIDQFLSALLT